jgi:hypothetical protein
MVQVLEAFQLDHQRQPAVGRPGVNFDPLQLVGRRAEELLQIARRQQSRKARIRSALDAGHSELPLLENARRRPSIVSAGCRLIASRRGPLHIPVGDPPTHGQLPGAS